MDIAENDQELLGRFELGMHRFATRTSEAIEGMDRATGDKGLVWILRTQLSGNEEQFIERLKSLQNIEIPKPTFRAYGVANGNAYLITEYVGGTKLPLIDGDVELKTKLYREAVAMVAEIHLAGIVLGDLSEDSFILRPNDGLCLVSLLGSFEKGRPRTAPPASVYNYVSLEQRSGMAPGMQTDVYALGILGYRLFTGQYPANKPHTQELGKGEDPLKDALPPSSIHPDLPVWCNAFFGMCLSLQLNERYQNASEALEDFDQALKTGSTKSDGRWDSKALAIRQETTGVMTTAQERELEKVLPEGVTEAVKPVRKEKKVPKYIFLAVFGVILGILTVGTLSLFRSGRPSGSQKPLIEYAELLPPEIQQAAQVVLDEGADTKERVSALRRIAENDNPATYSVLSSIVRLEATRAIRVEALEALGRRLRDVGYSRSAEVIENWGKDLLNQGKDPGQIPLFTAMLRACDLTMPLQTRRDSLHKASVDDMNSALRIAAALSLDDSDEDHFVPVLRQLLTSSNPSLGDLTKLNVPSLLTLNKFLVAFFERDIGGVLPRAKMSDISVMLESLAQLDHPLLYDVATEALRRKVIPPFQTVPLKALLDADRLVTNRSVKVALVRFARGDFKSDDITAVGRWTSLEFEPVLLSVCALIQDRDVGAEALETLSGRSVNSEPANELVKWFEEPKLWPNRKDFVKSLGIFGLYKLATEDQLSTAFEPLMPYAPSGTLLEIFIHLADARLIKMTLDRVAPITSSDILLQLTRHMDKDVRIAAVRALQGRNEVRALQELVQNYEREKDFEVRKVYEENHWVVKNRGTR